MDFAEHKGYYHAKVELNKYIEENYIELKDKTNEELNDIYMKVFGKAMTDFINKYDFETYKKERESYYY